MLSIRTCIHILDMYPSVSKDHKLSNGYTTVIGGWGMDVRVMFNRTIGDFVVHCGKCEKVSHVATTIRNRLEIPLAVACPHCGAENLMTMVTDTVRVEYSHVQDHVRDVHR